MKCGNFIQFKIALKKHIFTSSGKNLIFFYLFFKYFVTSVVKTILTHSCHRPSAQENFQETG